LNVSKIIPGDWGKVGPGWLARLLQDRIERLGGGGRIHQAMRSDEKPLRIESSSSGEFRA
jgi:hypothetical protein